MKALKQTLGAQLEVPLSASPWHRSWGQKQEAAEPSEGSWSPLCVLSSHQSLVEPEVPRVLVNSQFTT